jgi:hypothetical protein
MIPSKASPTKKSPSKLKSPIKENSPTKQSKENSPSKHKRSPAKQFSGALKELQPFTSTDSP